MHGYGVHATLCAMESNPAGDHQQHQVPVSPDGGWWVYLIECRGKRLYTGIAKDVAGRYDAHCKGRGARFTRAFPPVRLVVAVLFSGRSEASRVEAAIKRVPAGMKLAELVALQGRGGRDGRGCDVDAFIPQEQQ